MNLDSLQIDELIILCKKNKKNAQMEIYERFHQAMYFSALHIVGSSVIAEDVMQESFLTAFRKLDQYKGENKFAGWLKKITIRKALHQATIENRFLPLEFIPQEKEAEEATSSTLDRSRALRQALNQLQPHYRNALTLKYFEGYDYEEIGEILKLNYGACRTLISRAKQKLKIQLQVNE